MFLGSYEEACDSVFALLELEELSGKVDASSAVFFMVLGASTPFFEEVSIGISPIGYAIAQDDAWAVVEPWG